MFEVGRRYTVFSPFAFEGRGFDQGDSFEIIYLRYRNSRDPAAGCQFDHNFNGHSCEGKGLAGHCWWIRLDVLSRFVMDIQPPSWEL